MAYPEVSGVKLNKGF